ncbi:TPA: hypothetical protein ACGG57_004659, partial [Escherichia coli]
TEVSISPLFRWPNSVCHFTAGLPLVAIGKGLVINPEWVTLAESGRSHEIQTALNPQRVPELTILDKLWDQIQASKGTGWFPLMD